MANLPPISLFDLSSNKLANLAAELGDKEVRHSYVSTLTRQFLARQIRAFRNARPQKEFGEVIGQKQSAVSRLEDPNYGRETLQTLFEIGERLDVAVFVRFVDFTSFVRLTEDMSDTAARPQPYDQKSMDEFVTRSTTPDQSAVAAEASSIYPIAAGSGYLPESENTNFFVLGAPLLNSNVINTVEVDLSNFALPVVSESTYGALNNLWSPAESPEIMRLRKENAKLRNEKLALQREKMQLERENAKPRAAIYMTDSVGEPPEPETFRKTIERLIPYQRQKAGPL